MRTTLSLPNACLEEVPHLEGDAYTEMDLHGNYLCTLDQLPQTLVSLNIRQNKIDQEGLFFPFPSLEELNLEKNLLNVFEEEDFIMCFPSLKKLNMSYNKLRHIGFLRDSIIEHLQVSSNRIAIITGLPQTLKTLIADTNSITMVQSKLPPLVELLELSYNCLRFSGLPLNWPSTLRELHLNHNAIEQFPRKLPQSLEVLSLNANQLVRIPVDLPSSLKVLCCNDNRIRECPSFPRNRFEIFLLNNNSLTSLPNASCAKHFSAETNWNTSFHHTYQKMIAKCWKRYVFTLRLRHYKRTHTTREELFMVSMMPERWQQIDALDPVWFRKGPSHSRIDPH